MSSAPEQFYARVECDRRLYDRKLSRRKAPCYVVSGWGDAVTAQGQVFPLIVLLVMVQAESRAHALSQVLHDCPGGVVTFCRQEDVTPDRIGRAPVLRATAPLAAPAQLAQVEDHIRQIGAHSAAHKAQMKRNARAGRTDDAAFARIDREFPWPAPQPAYPLGGT